MWLTNNTIRIPIQNTDNAVRAPFSVPAAARFDGERVIFETPEFGVAPGQAAVLYAGDRVMGGGWIAETVAAEEALAA